jgi:hypothetical protein
MPIRITIQRRNDLVDHFATSTLTHAFMQCVEQVEQVLVVLIEKFNMD